ncbi:hypothetical protein DXG01_010432 [Tephrocybe rancida]|nr:hypothetical protein DXG01_010432 [Tephrocybe rancida]
MPILPVVSPNLTKVFVDQEYLLPTFLKFGSPKFRRWVLDHPIFQRYHGMRDIADTWERTTTDIFEEKKRALKEGDEALERQVGQGKDLISILRHLPSPPPIPPEERLRTELLEARRAHGGDIPYDDLVALPFMDAICRETLRLHAPVSKVLRVGIDGTEMYSILVPKNTKIIIAILNANRDPLLWGSDTLEWKPERWLAPLPEAVQEAPTSGIYSHLLTFLGGGRACIGFKFSQLEMKVVLAGLISQFRFFPPEKEIVWQMSAIATPTLKEFPGKCQLPLKMELINS